MGARSQVNGKCICTKQRHISKGAAKAQMRALIKLQERENGKKDFKKPERLHVYRSRECEAIIRDRKEVWHVGHR